MRTEPRFRDFALPEQNRGQAIFPGIGVGLPREHQSSHVSTRCGRLSAGIPASYLPSVTVHPLRRKWGTLVQSGSHLEEMRLLLHLC
jgi:hypothetical protein